MACEDGSLLQVTLKRGSKEIEDFTAEECITPGGVSARPLDQLLWPLWLSRNLGFQNAVDLQILSAGGLCL